MTPLQNLEPNPDQTPKPTPYLLPPGVRPDYYRDPRYKSPVVATMLSLMPGLGQVFLGYTQLGFLHAAVACALIALISTNSLGALEPGIGIFMAFFWLYNLVDAHRRALLLNEAITRMETPELPDAFQAISFQGRIAAGVILIFAGVLSLLSLRFGISMAWLADYWPLGLVLLGVYLVVRALRDKAAGSGSAQA